MKVLVLGGGAREHAICMAVSQSRQGELFSLMSNRNPGIERISKDVCISKETDKNAVMTYAESRDIDVVLIGPEAPLQEGITDALIQQGIMVCAPTKKAARIETDKEWMRNLLSSHDIKGQLINKCFTNREKAMGFIEELHGNVAIKPIGLTGGKGVRVSDDHFTTLDEA